MATAAQIRDKLFERVPAYMKLDFDNVGLLVGRQDKEVRRVLVSLDITLPVIREAEELGAELILAHHPVIFHPLKSVTDGDPAGEKVLALAEKGIAAICLHTNLDTAAGGVNDALMAAMGVAEPRMIEPHGSHPDGTPYGICRVGELPEAVALAEFLPRLKAALGANGLRYHDAGKPVRKLGCCGGSGGEYLEAALRCGCDTFVTGDVKYDRFLDAKALGINLIDAGHYPTEQVVVPVLRDLLALDFPELEVRLSAVHCQTAQFC